MIQNKVDLDKLRAERDRQNGEEQQRKRRNTIEDVLNHFDGVEEIGGKDDQWLALCPVHGDTNPSLAITLTDDDKVLLCCRSHGCDRGEIIKAVGLSWSDLFLGDDGLPKGQRTKKPKIVREYIYRQADGTPLLRVSRWEPGFDGRSKSFTQGAWKRGTWESCGAECSLPFRLSIALAAISEGKDICIAEGEKDAETLLSFGLAATTIAGGAAKGREDKRLETLDVFARAKRVVIFRDADETGAVHADAVAARLRPHVGEVRVVNMAPDKDITDAVVKRRLCRSEIEALIEAAPVWDEEEQKAEEEPRLFDQVDSAELKGKVFPEQRWIVQDMIAEGLNILVGAPKIGKSWLALGAADSVSSGGEMLGKKVDARTVLYLALEDGPRRLQKRSIMIGSAWSPRLHFVTQFSTGNQAIEDLERWMKRYPDTALVIVDTLARVWGIQDSNDYGQTYEAMGKLKAFADRHSIAVVLVHHTRKTESDDFLHKVMGSQGIAGAADAILMLSRQRGPRQKDAILQIDGRDVERQGYAIRFADNCRWEMVGDAEEVRMSKEKKDVQKLLLGNPMSPKEIAEALEKSQGAVRVLLHRMKEQGLVDQLEDGRYVVNSPKGGNTTPPSGEGKVKEESNTCNDSNAGNGSITCNASPMETVTVTPISGATPAPAKVDQTSFTATGSVTVTGVTHSATDETFPPIESSLGKLRRREDGDDCSVASETATRGAGRPRMTIEELNEYMRLLQ